MTVMGYLCHKWPRYVPLAVNTSQSFLHSWRINEFATRLTRRVPLVEQELFRSTKFTPSFSGIRLNRSLFLCGRFVDCCMSFCTFSFGHCVVCSSSIYGFWLPLWYLLAIVLSVLLRFTILITPVVSSYSSKSATHRWIYPTFICKFKIICGIV
jgi:hypothetical protein